MRSLIPQISLIGAGQAVSIAAVLGLQVYVVRSTDSAMYGAYVAALAVASLIEAIFVARSGELALQTVGKHWVTGRFATAWWDAKRLIRLDALLNSGLYICTVILAIVLARVFEFRAGYIAALALMIPLQIGYGVYKCLFIATARIKEQAAFEAVTAVAGAILGAGGVFVFGIPGLIAAQLGATLLRNLLARRITYQWWPEGSRDATSDASPSPAWDSWRSLGLHSVARNAFVSGSSQADLLILNAAQGPQLVAVYKVAKSLATIPSRVFSPLWFALRPRILQAVHENDTRRVLRLIGVPAALIMACFLVLIVPALVFADDVIGAIYGAEYRSAATPFLWLATGAWVFHAATAWFNVWIIISEEMTIGTSVYGGLFAVVVALGLLFGRQSEIHMAIAVSGSMIFASTLAWIVFIRRHRQRSAAVHTASLAGELS